ncbi:hypothetical protein FQA39_LY18330 [Lamprigera yunnana]|nr:hypothetical protein FQA39_LY18330 [Lamprigera yunnana]
MKCVGASLSIGDVEDFRHHCLSQAFKVDQDYFLLKYMNISIPVPRTRKECDNHKPKSVVAKYKMLDYIKTLLRTMYKTGEPSGMNVVTMITL